MQGQRQRAASGKRLRSVRRAGVIPPGHVGRRWWEVVEGGRAGGSRGGGRATGPSPPPRPDCLRLRVDYIETRGRCGIFVTPRAGAGCAAVWRGRVSGRLCQCGRRRHAGCGRRQLMAQFQAARLNLNLLHHQRCLPMRLPLSPPAQPCPARPCPARPCPAPRPLIGEDLRRARPRSYFRRVALARPAPPEPPRAPQCQRSCAPASAASPPSPSRPRQSRCQCCQLLPLLPRQVLPAACSLCGL